MTHPEAFLRQILQQALDAISDNRYGHIYRRDFTTGQKIIYHLDRDLEKLNACCRDFPVTKEQNYWEIIIECLEAANEDPLGTYKRPQDPICSHIEARGSEMYAFEVQLEDFTRPIYTKFCLLEQKDGKLYVSIDCHT